MINVIASHRYSERLFYAGYGGFSYRITTDALLDKVDICIITMKTFTYILFLCMALSCFGQSNTFLYNIDQIVPDKGQSVSVTFSPGAQFNTNPFQATLSYSLSKGPISSIAAVLQHGPVHYDLISVGDVVTGTTFTSEPIVDFLGSKYNNWTLIVTDGSHDNATMFLNSIRLTIPEAPSGALLLLGIFFLFVLMMYQRTKYE